jgi:hypothetical protein
MEAERLFGTLSVQPHLVFMVLHRQGHQDY